jgi:hypothetical protein
MPSPWSPPGLLSLSKCSEKADDGCGIDNNTLQSQQASGSPQSFGSHESVTVLNG